MHRAKLLLDQRRHLLGGDVWLRECSALVAAATVFAALCSIGVRAPTAWIPAEGHPAALARGSFGSEHGYLLLGASTRRIQDEDRIRCLHLVVGRVRADQASILKAEDTVRRHCHTFAPKAPVRTG